MQCFNLESTDLLEDRSKQQQSQISINKNNQPKWSQIGKITSPKAFFKEVLFLGKIRLTSLVVLSAMGGFAIAPVPLSGYTFCGLSAGVLLTSMCANSINQYLEAPYDLMIREY